MVATPKRTIALVNDLFFKEKIRATAEAAGAAGSAGVAVVFVSTEAALRQALAEGGATQVLVDLGIRGADPFQALAIARDARVASIAFVSHVETEARDRAKAAGCDRVLAKSELTRDLPAILGQG
jgi:CheY-like chemotaxis protein